MLQQGSLLPVIILAPVLLYPGAISSVTNITASGTVTGGTLTDGTASLASGSWTSLVGVTASGTIQFGSLSDGSITINDFLNSDTMSGAAVTNVPTALSVKNYVDSQVTASDLDFQGDSGGIQSVDLDSQNFTVAGGANIGTTGSGQTLTVNLSASLTGMTAATFSGGVTAATFTGNLTGAVTGNITGAGSSSLTTLSTTNLTAGGVAYPSSDGGSGQVISTNGSGAASWTTIPSLDANLQAFATQFTLPTADGKRWSGIGSDFKWKTLDSRQYLQVDQLSLVKLIPLKQILLLKRITKS